jgi:hypothetical protein
MAWLWRTSLGALAVLALLELVLRLLPVSTATQTGYYLDPAILTYPAGHRFTSSAGWDLQHAQRMQANNAGFLAHRDFTPNGEAIALVGDSHIEAAALDAAQRPDAMLEAALGGRPIYGLGSPGTSLLDYAERVRFAAAQWQVQDFVLLIGPGDIRQSLCGSGQIAAPCLDKTTGTPRNELQPAPGTLKRILRHSALAQYLFSQLKISLDAAPAALRQLPVQVIPGHLRAGAPGSGASAPAREAAADAALEAASDQVALAFFERVRPHVRGRMLLVLDRPFLPSLRRADFEGDTNRFIAIARAHGAEVLDMAPVYAAHARRSQLLLAVSPQDQHHNALGVKLLTRAMADAFQASASARASGGTP